MMSALLMDKAVTKTCNIISLVIPLPKGWIMVKLPNLQWHKSLNGVRIR